MAQSITAAQEWHITAGGTMMHAVSVDDDAHGVTMYYVATAYPDGRYVISRTVKSADGEKIIDENPNFVNGSSGSSVDDAKDACHWILGRVIDEGHI